MCLSRGIVKFVPCLYHCKYDLGADEGNLRRLLDGMVELQRNFNACCFGLIGGENNFFEVF